MKANLKVARAKDSLVNYMNAKGLNYYTHQKLAQAYADCLPDHVETDGMERNLDFFNRDLVDNRTLHCMAALIGEYNEFDAKAVERIVAFFGDKAQYSFGREGSPVIYVKPGSRVWFGGRQDVALESLADEVSFDSSLGMFRLWFD